MMEQLSLFDIEEPAIEEEKIKVVEDIISIAQNSLFDIRQYNTTETIINKYSGATNRIVKMASKRFVLEYNDKLVYLDINGNEEYTVANKKLAVLPIDQVIYYSRDFNTNQLQDNLFREYISKNRCNIDKVIRRIGDDNYIIITKNQEILSINNKGWMLEFKTMPLYEEDDVVLDTSNISDTEDIEEVKTPIVDDGSNIGANDALVMLETSSKDTINLDIPTVDTYHIDESVYITYCGVLYIGTIVSLYNNGETANVVFENKHTAFHISKLTKVA